MGLLLTARYRSRDLSRGAEALCGYTSHLTILLSELLAGALLVAHPRSPKNVAS